MFFQQNTSIRFICVAVRRLLLKFGPLFMKKLLLLSLICCALESMAQLTPGALAPDFTAQDIAGNSRNLYAELDAGKTVVLHCFAAWDSYAWEYYQEQALEFFDALYGSQGNGSVALWRVECEMQNSTAQLQGPASLTGNNATDTQGDWLTGSILPLIDDSTLAAQFDLTYLPVLVVICPDRLVRFADQLSVGNLANLVFQTACPPVVQGFEPALTSATTTRSCGSNVMDIQLVLKNLGTDTLFNVSIGIGGATAAQTIQWEGQLASYQSDTLEITSLEVLADADIDLSISSPNVDASNDSVSVRTSVGFSTQLVKLELALDAYPDEVSWEIRNENDSVLYSGGAYEVDYQYITGVFQLPAAGCYNLFLNDARGDGLHGSQYGGFDGFCKLYSMTDSTTVEEELFYYDGSYNLSSIENAPSFLQYTFEAGSPLEVSEIDAAEWLAYPIPATETLHVRAPSNAMDYTCSLYDMTSRSVAFVQMKPGERFAEINVEQLPAGVYALLIQLKHEHIQIPVIIQHR